jgi:hypothetical protein
LNLLRDVTFSFSRSLNVLPAPACVPNGGAPATPPVNRSDMGLPVAAAAATAVDTGA